MEDQPPPGGHRGTVRGSGPGLVQHLLGHRPHPWPVSSLRAGLDLAHPKSSHPKPGTEMGTRGCLSRWVRTKRHRRFCALEGRATDTGRHTNGPWNASQQASVSFSKATAGRLLALPVQCHNSDSHSVLLLLSLCLWGTAQGLSPLPAVCSRLPQTRAFVFFWKACGTGEANTGGPLSCPFWTQKTEDKPQNKTQRPPPTPHLLL